MNSSGLTLPVWVAAAARSATEVLIGRPFAEQQIVELPNNQTPLRVAVSSAALLAGGKQAMGISHCDSRLALDLTSDMEIWVVVQLLDQLGNDCAQKLISSDYRLRLIPGFGVGISKSTGEACLSDFAMDLLKINLHKLVPLNSILQLEVVFPRGKELAARTSNHAFGVVDGLALIGTQAEAQISASPEQLEENIQQLRSKCAKPNFSGHLTFVIGENGFDLACKLGLDAQSILKTGNWLGPLLVAAGESGVNDLLVLGYHGKLVKLAGGIFHTHHHLADARLEILISLAFEEGLPLHLIRSISESSSIQEALIGLEVDQPEWAERLWVKIASKVEERSKEYVRRYGNWSMAIGAVLFDRQRRLRWAGPIGHQQADILGVTLEG